MNDRDAPNGTAQEMAHLVGVVQELSRARSIEAVQAIVRRAARALTNADGASFVLRERDACVHVDEEAIARSGRASGFRSGSASAAGRC